MRIAHFIIDFSVVSKHFTIRRCWIHWVLYSINLVNWNTTRFCTLIQLNTERIISTISLKFPLCFVFCLYKALSYYHSMWILLFHSNVKTLWKILLRCYCFERGKLGEGSFQMYKHPVSHSKIITDCVVRKVRQVSP